METESRGVHCMETGVVSCLFDTVFFFMQSTKEWRDITQLLHEAASEISDGSFIASDSFNYEASMRSIDIMDKKVDSGMALVGFETIEERLEHGLSLPNHND